MKPKKRNIPKQDYFYETPKRKSDLSFTEGMLIMLLASLLIYCFIKYF